MWDNDGNSSFNSPLRRQFLSDQETLRALSLSGVPKRYLSSCFSKIPADLVYAKSLKSYIRCLPSHLSSGCGLILTGPYGTGKTAASILVLKELVKRGGVGHFVSSRDIAAMRSSFAPADKVRWSSLSRWGLLVLDEVGIDFNESDSETTRVRRATIDIIRRRYEAQLPTVITTNFGFQDLANNYESLATIFVDGFNLIQVSQYDWRCEEYLSRSV